MLSASPAASVGSGLKPNLGCEMFNFHQFPSMSSRTFGGVGKKWQNHSECLQTWNPTVGSEAFTARNGSKPLWHALSSRSAVAPSAPNTAGECIASHNACVASFHSDARDSPAAYGHTDPHGGKVRKNGTCTWHLRENRETELSASTEVALTFLCFSCFWGLNSPTTSNDQTPSPISPGVLNRYPAPPVSCWVSPWNLLASACPSLPILADCPGRSSNMIQIDPN